MLYARRRSATSLVATSIIVGVAGLTASPVALAQTVNTGAVTVQVDNYHAVYTGTLTTVHFVGSSSGKFPPAAPGVYNISTTDDYLYIAAWSDDSVQQGMLCDLTINGDRLKTGDPFWMVYATGQDLDTLAVPTIGAMNAAIATANSAAGAAASTSVGWVLPAVGGFNDGTFPPTNPWPAQAGIGADVNWIWYDSGDQSMGAPIPFRPGFNHREFLIFRIPISICPPDDCPADFNGDGVVDGADLAFLLANWGDCLPCPGCP